MGEMVWRVFSSFGYLMGAASDGSDLMDNGRAGRVAVENYFKSVVNPQDVIDGNVSKVNAAAKATAVYFLNMFGGKPRGATGVAAGDLQGSCMAYSAGPSQSYATQSGVS